MTTQPPAPAPSTSAVATAPIESHIYVLCHACDYDLTGGILREGILTCPECGYRQEPIQTARWPAAWTRLLLMTSPSLIGLVAAIAGAMMQIKPLLALGMAVMVLGGILAPVIVTRWTLRRGYVSERRAATADRLMLVAIAANFALAVACVGLCWERLESIK